MLAILKPRSESTTYGGAVYTRYPRSKNPSQRRYYRRYMPKQGIVMLHRQVWIDAHGPIMAGYQVHHRDNRYDNNTIDNLELVEAHSHRQFHPEHVRRIRRYAGRGTLGVRIGRRLRKWREAVLG